MHRRMLSLAAAASALVFSFAALPGAAAGSGMPSTYTPPPLPSGTMADLGSPMSSLTVVEGDFGPLPDGSLAAYAVPMGENAPLNVSTTTGNPTTQLGQFPMPGASGAPTIAVGPDGKVYLGTYYEGHLFQWDPATQVMTDLGQVPGNASYVYGLSVAPDGTVYGGSHPNATVWSWSPNAGFADLGVTIPDPGVQYTRVVVDPDHNALWIGTQPIAHLYRLDLGTRALTEIALRAAPKAVTSIPDLDYAEDHVFVNYGGYLRVVDANTSTEITYTDADTKTVPTGYAVSGRGVSEARQGGVYFSGATYNSRLPVVRYDLATNTVKRTGQNATRGALIGFGWAIENGHDVLYGFAGNYSGGGLRYDIDAGKSGSLQFQISPTPSPLQHVLSDATGSSVLVNAFLNGNTVRYDVASGAITPVTRLGQVEDWTLLDATVQAGTYPNGQLVQVPADATSTTALKVHATLKDTASQIRPIEAKAHRGEVWYGTEPDYGLRGGTVTIVDPATGAVEIHRDVVPQHTIAAITFVGDAAYLGSSTEGGTGTDPLPGSGHLVQWDRASSSVVRDVVPVEGAGSINALAEHNGALYGLADHTLFEADPVTLAVRRTVQLDVSEVARAGTGELVFHPNGYLYVSMGKTMLVVDPLSFAATPLAAGTTHRLELAPDGTLWTLLRPDGFANHLNLGRYTPTASECGTPDTRDHVTLFGTTTTVRNRFLRTGCTLQDLFPLPAAEGRAYAGTVNPWLDRLVASGAISPAERDLLWEAAKKGR